MRWMYVCASLTASCGRLGFDSNIARGDAANADGATDVASRDSPPASIAYVQSFVARAVGPGASDTFTAQAVHAGDAIAIQIACNGTQPTSASLTATNWNFVQVGPIGGQGIYAAAFGAIAPDTAPVTVTVNWGGTTCQTSKSELGDEFTNTRPDATVFEAGDSMKGTGPDCSASTMTTTDHAAVWGACATLTTLLAIGPGYTKGSDNGANWSEYKITTDPAHTNEVVSFTNENVDFVITTLTLDP